MSSVCLGIESTAHTLGVGISSEKKVLANAVAFYRSPPGEGMLPRKAADHHQEKIGEKMEEALQAAGKRLSDIDVFAFSQGPGIGQCLRVSCITARYLAQKYGKPILGINHCRAHLEISMLETGFADPIFLYVSGGNTQVIVREAGIGKTAGKNARRDEGAREGDAYRVLGETLDIGIGNLFDVFARSLGEGFAHGSTVEKLAGEGKYIEMPYVIKGMNFSFSGLLTHAQRMMKKEKKEDVCHSLMETSFAVLCEACERALCLTGKRELIVCGGVAQNKKLQGMLEGMCKEQKVKFGAARNEFNADNGAMIAYCGADYFAKGKRMRLEECFARQDWRVDSE